MCLFAQPWKQLLKAGNAPLLEDNTTDPDMFNTWNYRISALSFPHKQQELDSLFFPKEKKSHESPEIRIQERDHVCFRQFLSFGLGEKRNNFTVPEMQKMCCYVKALQKQGQNLNT